MTGQIIDMFTKPLRKMFQKFRILLDVKHNNFLYRVLEIMKNLLKQNVTVGKQWNVEIGISIILSSTCADRMA
jgi:hypothetical protein